MWLFVLSAFALVFAACSRVTYPGDGRLVIVVIEPELDGCPIPLDDGSSTTLGAVIRSGIRFWDQAGARLRTEDQLTSDELTEAKNAPRLRITGDKCSEAGADVQRSGTGTTTTAGVAEYSYDGFIYLPIRKWDFQKVTSDRLLSFVNMVAHEAGHAIDLEHVSDQNAIMCASGGNLRMDLAPADFTEYRRVWN